MNLKDLTSHAGEWLRGSGPMSDVVISSRVRLARNVSGFPFLTKCNRHERQTLEAKARHAILSAQLSPRLLYVNLEEASELDDCLNLEHLMRLTKARARSRIGRK